MLRRLGGALCLLITVSLLHAAPAEASTSPPSAPTSFSLTKSDASHSATITWQPPTSTGGLAVTGYRVARDGVDSTGSGPWSSIVPATARSQTFTNLVAGKAYTLSVRAITSAGTGAAASGTTTLVGPPALPSSVTVSKSDRARTATIAWQPPSNNGGSAVTGYRVARNGIDANGSGPWSTTVSRTTRSFTFTNLRASTTYTLSVRAINVAGTGPAAKVVAAIGQIAWRTPATVDAGGGLPTSVSCPSSGFCASVDDSANVTMWNGATWSRPVNVVPSTGRKQSTISCVSSSFCALLTGNEFGLKQLFTYNGTRWTAGPTAYTATLSCASSTLCFALGAENLRFNGAGWVSEAGPAITRLTTVISCLPSGRCVASSSTETAIFNGSSWATVAGPGLADLTGLSCVSPTFCMATGQSATNVNAWNSKTFNGSTWSAERTVFANTLNMVAVSCVSTTFCVAVDNEARTATFKGLGWTIDAPPSGFAARNGADISCSTTTSCVYVGTRVSARVATRLTASGWVGQPFNPGGTLRSVSCPSDSFCAAVDVTGQLLRFNGATWSAPSPARPAGGLFEVSCTSSSFCMATVDNVGVLRFNGATWSKSKAIPALYAGRISCTSTTFCAVIGPDDVAFTFNGSTWTQRAVPSGFSLNSLDCVSATWCLAFGEQGDVARWNGTAWIAQAKALSGSPAGEAYWLSSLSCVSRTYCLVYAQDLFDNPYAATYNGSLWTTTAAPPVLNAVSCSAVSTCVGVGDAASAAWNGSAWRSVTLAMSALAVSCTASRMCAAVGGAQATTSR